MKEPQFYSLDNSFQNLCKTFNELNDNFKNFIHTLLDVAVIEEEQENPRQDDSICKHINDISDWITAEDFVRKHSRYFSKNYKHLRSATNSIYHNLKGRTNKPYLGVIHNGKIEGEKGARVRFSEKEMLEYIGL